MKVLIAAPFYGENMNIGGAEAVVKGLSSGLQERGFSVTVFATHPLKSKKVIISDGIRIIYNSPHNLFWHLNKNDYGIFCKTIWHLVDLWNPMMFLAMRRVIREEAPDIIHFHKLTGFSPAIWAATRGKYCNRSIQTCHDYEAICPETTMQGKAGEWISQRKWFVQPYLKWRAWLSNRVKTVTAPSRFTLEMIISYDYFESTRKAVIPNSHGFTRQQCAQLRSELIDSRQARDRGPLRILFVGRLTEVKGADLLCRAVSSCLADGRDILLDVAGTGRQESSLREQFGMERRIRFHGQVAGKQKDQLLRSADLMVVPSNCPEVFGIVIVEAFAYGLPVLATKVGGIPELIEHGKTGFLVTAGDAVVLTEAIDKIVDRRADLSDFSSQCFEAALKFCTEDIIESYVSLYSKVLKDAVKLR